MGDRISIRFVNGDRESVALFSHWGGRAFLKEALQYIRELKKEIGEKKEALTPLGRLEPSTVMVDFIRHLTKDMDRLNRDLYLGKDEDDGDNWNNGHWDIDLISGDFIEG